MVDAKRGAVYRTAVQSSESAFDLGAEGGDTSEGVSPESESGPLCTPVRPRRRGRARELFTAFYGELLPTGCEPETFYGLAPCHGFYNS